jgi:hypothetical protein
VWQLGGTQKLTPTCLLLITRSAVRSRPGEPRKSRCYSRKEDNTFSFAAIVPLSCFPYSFSRLIAHRHTAGGFRGFASCVTAGLPPPQSWPRLRLLSPPFPLFKTPLAKMSNHCGSKPVGSGSFWLKIYRKGRIAPHYGRDSWNERRGIMEWQTSL